MSLFVFRETTVDQSGTKVIKERISWKPILLIAALLLATGGTIWFFASRSGSDTAPTMTNPAPIQTPSQAPVQSTPAATDEPAPAGVIKTTTEKLVRQFKPDPKGNSIQAYKGGTVFQVSGVLRWQKERFPVGGDVYFSLGPAYKTSIGNIVVIFAVNLEKEPELFKALASLEGDREVVVRGTYFTFDNSNEGGVILKNVSLISVAPK